VSTTTAYFCRHCGRRKRAELPPAGWLRVQVADPEPARHRAAGWSSTAAGGLFCGLACLLGWATDRAAAAATQTSRAEEAMP